MMATRRSPLAEKDRWLICEMHSRDVSISKMARVMDCSESTICRVIKEADMPSKTGKTKSNKPPQAPWTAADDTAIRRAVADGREVGVVAKNIARSVDAVRRRACDIGCPFPVVWRFDGPTPLHPAEARRNYESVAAKLRFEDVAVRRDPRTEFARSYDCERKAATS